MKPIRLLIILAAALVVVLVAGFVVARQAEFTGQQWEYASLLVSNNPAMILAGTNDADETLALNAAFGEYEQPNSLAALNLMGESGWELTGVATYNNGNVVQYILKRPVE